jgi:3-methyladenine DNA glycosylase AlkC
MAEQLKNLYNEKFIKQLSLFVKKYYKDFDNENFYDAILDESWKTLELKQRMRHISIKMKEYLPQDYSSAIKILKQTYKEMDSFGYRLENIIFQDFVELYGCEHWDISMDALECFTINCSSEFAIRQFILKDENRAMKQMLRWAKSENHEIRRLASEGCRSRLPWAISLPCFKKDPTKVLEILELLKDDESKYVQKSVANNINDISKDNEKIVIDIVKKWKGFSKSRDWILKHGSRTLLKASHSEILTLFGYEKPNDIKIENFTSDSIVRLGEEFHFRFDITSDVIIKKLRLEYKLEFLRANGKHNAKVFKISEVNDFIGTKSIDKKYSFKTISTRRYYLGEHRVSIMVNGIAYQECNFRLAK